jgi:hypothetical protein
MYNFEEIKEVIMPYLEGLYDPMFTMYPYNAEHKVLYNKDEVFIVAHENMRLLECLGLNKEHQDQITMLSYNICSRNMNAMFEELENSDEYKRELERHNEELGQYLSDIEELQAQEAAVFEESLRYYDTNDMSSYEKEFIIPSYCNIISAMVCYMNGEFTKDMLIASIMQSTDNNKDVKEHLETIL